MRYSIRLAGLQHCGESLEQAARRQRQEIDELDTAIRQLSRQWCMDDVVSLLRKERQKMEEQVQLTLSMAQAARRCCEVYRETENKAIDGLDCPRHVLGGRSAAAGGGGPASAQQLNTARYTAALREAGVNIRLAE